MGTMRSTGWFTPQGAILARVEDELRQPTPRVEEPEPEVAELVVRGLRAALPVVVVLTAFALVLHYSRPRWF